MQILLDNLALEALPPGDWKHLAKDCLSGRDYYCGKLSLQDNVRPQLRNRTKQASISFAVLIGERTYKGTEQQLNFDIAS